MVGLVMRARELDSPSVVRSSTGMGARSGWNLNQEKELISGSQFPVEVWSEQEAMKAASPENPAIVLLAEGDPVITPFYNA